MNPDGQLRHPSFKGVRADVAAEDVTREERAADSLRVVLRHEHRLRVVYQQIETATNLVDLASPLEA